MEHIRFSDIYFSYEKNAPPVLSAVSFSVEKNKTVCIAGSNGCGKSTLLQLAACCLKPSCGAIIINGDESQNSRNKRESGIVFQEPDHQLFMPSIWEDVAFGVLKKGMSVDEARAAAFNALKMVEAEYIAEKPPYKLSGGEKQRAALAGVLIMQPEILVLDEPSAALDPRARKNLITLLRTIKCTKLIASHDLDLVLDIADKVIFVHNGKIAAQSSVPGLLTDKAFLQSIGLELPLSVHQ
ncbi:MAG: energy-coupling factor ABC transporter ATP-binding protein [Spirochaetaceae bacterium]|jgi:cobalt/nickel transport system ATP-binding protein|nr:energy-coupling factor ABC transporter ATP-binding protein [Spirochaetaceae bacterium]